MNSGRFNQTSQDHDTVIDIGIMIPINVKILPVAAGNGYGVAQAIIRLCSDLVFDQIGKSIGILIFIGIIGVLVTQTIGLLPPFRQAIVILIGLCAIIGVRIGCPFTKTGISDAKAAFAVAVVSCNPIISFSRTP